MSGSGTLTQGTLTKNSGTSARKLAKTAALDAAFCRQRLYARTGERLQVTWALRGDGVATAVLRLWNVHTGRYLQPDGASWGALATRGQQTAASWGYGGVTFTVEGYDVTRRGVVDLWLELLDFGVGSAWADDLSVIPAVNFTSVHGHNLDALVTPELRSSTDVFADVDTLEHTLAARPGAFYQRLGETFRRYWRLKLVGGPNYTGGDLARGVGARTGARARA